MKQRREWAEAGRGKTGKTVVLHDDSGCLLLLLLLLLGAVPRPADGGLLPLLQILECLTFERGS